MWKPAALPKACCAVEMWALCESKMVGELQFRTISTYNTQLIPTWENGYGLMTISSCKATKKNLMIWSDLRAALVPKQVPVFWTAYNFFTFAEEGILHSQPY